MTPSHELSLLKTRQVHAQLEGQGIARINQEDPLAHLIHSVSQASNPTTHLIDHRDPTLRVVHQGLTLRRAHLEVRRAVTLMTPATLDVMDLTVQA